MNISLLDPIGAGCSILATYYFTQARSCAFPISLFAIGINSILYFQKGIYAHLGLEAIYVVSSVYGWYCWSTQTGVQLMPATRFITRMPILTKIVFGVLAVISIPLLALGLQTCTDSDVPYWDATTTLLALLAQWMLCKKWIECWAIWFVVDALVAILHWAKGIPFHSVTHLFYLGMAVVGYLKWRKMMERDTSGIPPSTSIF